MPVRTSLLILIFILSMQGPVPAEEGKVLAPEPQIERGEPNILFDSVGYILSTPKRILLLNPDIDTHHVSPETEKYIAGFVQDNPELMKDVKIRINQWTPMGEMKRLIDNKKMSWWWRIFPGIPATAISSLTGRLFGGDHYNPFTDTIHIYSDDPAVLLHEAGHAKDFSRYAKEEDKADLYMLGGMLPSVTLYQEYAATSEAIEYLKDIKDRDAELKSYGTLLPAYGTYLGKYTNMPYSPISGAILGHIAGYWHKQEARAGYRALDNAIIGDTVITDLSSDPLAHNLISHKEQVRRDLFRTLSQKEE